MTAINFCPACGHRLEDQSPLFCSACGHRLPQTQSTSTEHTELLTKKTLIEPAESAAVPAQKVAMPTGGTTKPKVKSWWIWVGVLFVLLGGIIAYGMYEDARYPKSESALQDLLLNRYWKMNEGSIREVYIDGKKITKSGSDIRHTIKDAVEGNTDGAIYDVFEKGLKDIISRDNFLNFRKLKSGKLFYFQMDYSDSENEYTYNTYRPELSLNSETSRYRLSIPDGISLSSSMSTGAWIEDDDGTSYKNYTIQISKITSNALELKVDATILSDGQELRVVIEYTYDIYTPPSNYIQRVDKEQEIANEMEDLF